MTSCAADVCVVGIARTPIGSYGGSLSGLSAVNLGVIAIKGAFAPLFGSCVTTLCACVSAVSHRSVHNPGALEKAGVSAADVQETYFGNVMSGNLGQNPARQCAIGAGVPPASPATTVNKVCSSGMKGELFAGVCRIAISFSLCAWRVSSHLPRSLGHHAWVARRGRVGWH